MLPHKYHKVPHPRGRCVTLPKGIRFNRLWTPKALKIRVNITLSILDGKDSARWIARTCITATVDICHPRYGREERGSAGFEPEDRGGDDGVVVRAAATACPVLGM